MRCAPGGFPVGTRPTDGRARRRMLSYADRWVWDFWFARDGDEYHVFYLQAPKALGDPEARHRNATIGHALSRDLRTWAPLPDALGPGPPGTWDDLATWTGSVIGHDGRWWMCYTGISTREAAGCNASASRRHRSRPLRRPGDLDRVPAGDHTGRVRPSRSPAGDRDRRPVVSAFSVYGYAHAATRRRRARAVTGTHCMVGDDPLGPFSALSDEFFAGDLRGSSYAGKLIADPDGQLVYLAFAQHPDDGPFRGALTDPAPVHIAADGRLHLVRTPW